MSLGAKIISIPELAKLKAKLGKLIVASGGFDPIHPGHISYLHESKKHGDCLAVLVNGDSFLKAKKGKPFQDLSTRCLIVSSVRGVDYVVPFEIEDDSTVCRPLEQLRPHVFTKGGDRVDADSIPEWGVCKRHGIEIVTGVGLDKAWSSSEFLKEWDERSSSE